MTPIALLLGKNIPKQKMAKLGPKGAPDNA